MNERITYPIEWAVTFPQCCMKAGTSFWNWLMDITKTKAEYLAVDAHWFSIEGLKYTPQEMDSAWNWLTDSREHLQAHYLVRTGKFTNYNDAKKSLK